MGELILVIGSDTELVYGPQIEIHRGTKVEYSSQSLTGWTVFAGLVGAVRLLKHRGFPMGKSKVGQEPPPTAREICARFGPGPEARALLRDSEKAGPFFQRLLEKELYRDAIGFTAYLLPKREGVWWGCLCVWQVSRPDPPEKIRAALQAAVRWVLDPNEQNRRAAEAAGKEAGPGTPAGSVALAAFSSDGSLSRPGLPEVPPPPFLTAKLIMGALLSAAAQGDPAKITERYRQFLTLGIEVDDATNRWE